MYNNTNNNMNPLFSLLGGLMPSGGGQQGGQQGGGSQPAPSGGGGMDQSNPLMQLLAAMMSGQNAMNALNTILPQAGQMMQNRGGQDMEQFVRNEYNRQGVDINAAMQQLQQLMNTMNGGTMNGGQQHPHISNTNNNNNTNGGNYNANNNTNY